MLHLRPRLLKMWSPEDSGLAWIQGFAPVSETVLNEQGGHWLSLKDPPPLPVPTSAATPVVVPVAGGLSGRTIRG